MYIIYQKSDGLWIGKSNYKKNKIKIISGDNYDQVKNLMEPGAEIKLRAIKSDLAYLSYEQEMSLNTFLNIDKDTYKFGIYLILHLGLKRNEICVLKRKDFDFVNFTLTINRLINSSGNVVENENPRVIPISMNIIAYARFIGIDKFSPNTYIISKSKTDFTLTRTYQNILNRYLNELKIENTSFSELRNTFAIRFLECGGDIAVLSNLLGHSSIAITEKIYNYYVTFEEKVSQMKKYSNISNFIMY